MLTGLLTGCNTTQTLAAQLGMAELPTKVARKLYGVCGRCGLDPNCPVCKATQRYNRKLAGAPQSQRSQFPTAGVKYQPRQSYANVSNQYGYGNQSYDSYDQKNRNNNYNNNCTYQRYGNSNAYNNNNAYRYNQPDPRRNDLSKAKGSDLDI